MDDVFGFMRANRRTVSAGQPEERIMGSVIEWMTGPAQAVINGIVLCGIVFSILTPVRNWIGARIRNWIQSIVNDNVAIVFENRFRAVESSFAAMDNRLDTMDNRFDILDNRLDTMDNRLDTVDNRLDTLEKKFVPIKKQVRANRRVTLKSLRVIKEGLQVFGEKFDDMDDILEGIRKDIKGVYAERQVTMGYSPVRLTEFGEKVSATAKAREWADDHAGCLIDEVESKSEFDIFERCVRYIKDAYETDSDFDRGIREAAYEHAIERENVHKVYEVELRDRLLHLKAERAGGVQGDDP